MSISAQNATYFGSVSPVASGSTILAFGGSSLQEFAYAGTATFTGDNSTTSGVLNFIDGTNALSFTPTAVIATRTGGNATATQTVASISTLNNVACTVNFSAAPGTGNTLQVAFIVLK